MIQGRVDRKEGGGRGRRAGSGDECWRRGGWTGRRGQGGGQWDWVNGKGEMRARRGGGGGQRGVGEERQDEGGFYRWM